VKPLTQKLVPIPNNPKKNIEKGTIATGGVGLAYFLGLLCSGIIVNNNPELAPLRPAITGTFSAILAGIGAFFANRLKPHYK